MLCDPKILKRKDHLVAEVKITLQAIRNLGDGSHAALTDPHTLAEAVRVGILDAPQLKNNPFAPGAVRTRVLDGACETVDENGKIIDEQTRLQNYL